MNLKKIVAIALATTLITGCSSTSTGTESATLLDQIKESGELKVAIEGTYSPYTYHDEDNNIVGYDVEIAEAVAEKLGVKAVFTETKWDGIIAGLDAKQYDVIFNQVGVTAEREEKYLFSTPYTYTYGVIITKADNNSISSFDDLNGKKSAQTTTSNWADTVRDYGGEIVPTDGFVQSIDLVLQGRADATVNDNVTFYDYLKSNPDAKVKVAAQSTEVNTSAALIRQEDGAELKKAIDQALKELSEDGTLTKISNKYFGEDVSVAK